MNVAQNVALVAQENKRKIEPKEIPSCLILRLLVVFTRQLEISTVKTSNFTYAEPNTCLGRPKLLSSTVDSDGRTLHVQNLIRGEKKYHPYCLK